ncbi:MAG: gamma-glutamyl-gamma-aminobutyrate hydrolase family protein [Acidobacteriota bacterium]
MKKISASAAAVFLAVSFILFFSGCSHEVSSPEPESGKEKIQLTICYTSVGSLQALKNLREKGLIPLENLQIIGIYHEKERTDYQRSRNFINEEGLHWIEIKELKGEINSKNIYHENPLTIEFSNIFQSSDGIIFFGGPDIPPYLYGCQTSFLTRIDDPYRHFFELSFIFHLLGGKQEPDASALLDNDPEFPVLGICLGAQSLNVGTGGTLVQDIWLDIYGCSTWEEAIELGPDKWHVNPWSRLHPEKNLISYSLHQITWEEGTFFPKELEMPFGEYPYIVSSHHQSVAELGQDFQVAASTLGGKVIEAIAHSRYPNVLGLQFHPEFPIIYDQNKSFSFTPRDTEAISLPHFLKEHPPSFIFHQKIWSWFSSKLRESQAKKSLRQ